MKYLTEVKQTAQDQTTSMWRVGLKKVGSLAMELVLLNIMLLNTLGDEIFPKSTKAINENIVSNSSFDT